MHEPKRETGMDLQPQCTSINPLIHCSAQPSSELHSFVPGAQPGFSQSSSDLLPH